MNATPSGTEAKNLIKIDVGSNPKLKDYFSRLEDGHVCRLEIEFSKTGMSGDMIEGSVSTISPEDYEEEAAPVSREEKPGNDVGVNDKEPVMVSVGPPGGPGSNGPGY